MYCWREHSGGYIVKITNSLVLFSGPFLFHTLGCNNSYKISFLIRSLRWEKICVCVVFNQDPYNSVSAYVIIKSQIQKNFHQFYSQDSFVSANILSRPVFFKKETNHSTYRFTKKHTFYTFYIDFWKRMYNLHYFRRGQPPSPPPKSPWSSS